VEVTGPYPLSAVAPPICPTAMAPATIIALAATPGSAIPAVEAKATQLTRSAMILAIPQEVLRQMITQIVLQLQLLEVEKCLLFL